MRLLSLYMEGFKTFAKPVTFDFTAYPEDGLCFVTGDNKVDPDLGANGTGKSTLFDSVCHAFFGKTSRGLKATDLASWQLVNQLADKAEQSGKKVTKKDLTPSLTTQLTFENYSGETCVLLRRWNPNVLTLQVNDGEPRNVEQNEVDALIGYTFDEFLNAAYFSQFGELFMDMGSTERSALVAKVLNLDVWDKYADTAKAAADEQRDKVDEGRRQIERLKGQIDELELQDLSNQIAAWDEDWAEELAELEQVIAEHAKQQGPLVEAAEAADEALAAKRRLYDDEAGKQDAAIRKELAKLDDGYQAALVTVDDQIEAIEDAREAAVRALDAFDGQTELRELSKAEATLQAKLERLEASITDTEARMVKVKGSDATCHACGQELPGDHAEHMERELNSLAERIEQFEDQCDAAEEELRDVRRKIRKLEKAQREATDKRKGVEDGFREQLADLRNQRSELEREQRTDRRAAEAELRDAANAAIKALRDEVDVLTEEANKADRAFRDWKRASGEMQDDLETVKADQNPHRLQHDANLRRLAKLSAEREECYGKLETMVEDEQASRYWVKGFKNVKLFAVSSALNELEAEVNNALDGLGLGGWSVEFDVDKETKSGTLSKGFFAFINGPDNLEPVRWEAWSGGESQRLRLAASLGLANLIRSSKGLDLPFEIWDEPSQWMSDAGITGLLDVLQRRARRLKRQIWLIDHRGLEHPFDAAICVEKSHEGSTIKNVTAEFTGSH